MSASHVRPSVLQIGANSHSTSTAFVHDPVPRLIANGWRAVLVEPQPDAAVALRHHYAGREDQVRVVEAAFCPSATARAMPLYFVNATKTLGANESDVRCVGDAIFGTASFSKAQVLRHQRWYRFTPSQCMACARRLGRPLPPTCMRRVYTDNLDVLTVPCASPEQLLASASSRTSSSRGIDALIVDVEGEDDRVVNRYLDLLAGAVPPPVVVYEHVHLGDARNAALRVRLRGAGMRPFNWASMRSPPARSMPPATWNHLRRVLRGSERDNAVWVRIDQAPGVS